MNEKKRITLSFLLSFKGILYVISTVLEKAMATHSSTLAWKIPWTEEPGRLSPWDCEESDMTE